MDFIIGFFAGLVWWELILLTVCIVGTGISLFNESGIAFLVIIVFGLWYFFQPDITIGMVVTYFAVGVLWLLFKFKQHATKIIDKMKDMAPKTPYTKETVRQEVFRDINKDTLFFWGIAWPFSVIGFFINDFMEALVKKFIKLVTRYVDHLIETAGFK